MVQRTAGGRPGSLAGRSAQRAAGGRVGSTSARGGLPGGPQHRRGLVGGWYWLAAIERFRRVPIRHRRTACNRPRILSTVVALSGTHGAEPAQAATVRPAARRHRQKPNASENAQQLTANANTTAIASTISSTSFHTACGAKPAKRSGCRDADRESAIRRPCQDFGSACSCRRSSARRSGSIILSADCFPSRTASVPLYAATRCS